MNKLLTALAIFTAFFSVSVNAAHAAPGDYDGDGLSDLAIIDSDEPEDKTTVFVRKSTNGGLLSYVFFPFGNYVISGSYFGDRKTYPGIVSIPQTSPLLRWHIKNPSNQDVVLNYGLKTDVVPNQSDLDCDGITDFVVVRAGSAAYWPGFRLWYAALSSSPGAVHEVVFGMVGDDVYTGDTDGDGCAELIALRSGFQWFSKKYFGQDVSFVQWGLPGDIPLLPSDLNGDGAPDYTVVRPVGSDQIAYVRLGAGVAGTQTLGSSVSIPFSGNIFGTNTLGWFERSQGRFGLKTPFTTTVALSFGNERRGLLRPDGTEISEGESGRFQPATATVATTSDDDGGVSCSTNINRKDGPGGFKNNPENSKNTLKVMYPASYTGKISAVRAYADGKVFDTLKLGGLEWGNRERWYGRKSLSSYPENLLVVATLKDGRNACVTLPDAEKVYD